MEEYYEPTDTPHIGYHDIGIRATDSNPDIRAGTVDATEQINLVRR